MTEATTTTVLKIPSEKYNCCMESYTATSKHSTNTTTACYTPSIKVDITDTRFPFGKRLGEWRKNETKSIQRETNTTTPEIEE